MKQDNILQNLQLLSNVLETGKSAFVENFVLGKIYIQIGHFKNLKQKQGGKGLLHIVEERHLKNKKDVDFITALLPLILESAKSKIFETREVKRKNKKEKRFIFEEKGIRAIVAIDEEEGNQNFVLSGYDLDKKKQEATDAIQTVIAQYGYLPEYFNLRKQVGAVASQVNIVNSDQNVNQNFKKNDKEKNMETRQNPRSLLDEVRRIIKEELGDSNTRQGKIKILNETIKSSSVARDLIRGYYGEVDVFFCEYASEIASLYREVTGEKYYPFTAAHQMVMDGFALCAGKLYHELMQRIEDSED